MVDDYEDDEDDEDYEEEPRRRRGRRDPELHSGLGIASFVIAMVSGLLFLAMFGVAIGLAAGGHRQFDEKSPAMMIIGLMGCGSGVVSLIGAVLGIVGMCQADRKTVFAILGFIFNALIVLAIIGVTVTGMVANAGR